MNKPLRGFISYSHEDTEAKNKLRRCLAVMEQQNKLITWHDGDITGGGKARQEDILQEVADSDMLLYLVSAASLASKNCNKELAEALRANITIIPIILENCDWQNHQLSSFQAFPDKGLPINKWEPESDGWQDVVDGIRKAITKMQSQLDSPSGTSEKEQHTESAVQQDNVLMMLGRMDQAVERDPHAVKLDSNNADAYFNLGNAYHRKGDYNRAIDAFTRAVAIRGDFAEAYTNRGLAFQNKGDFDLAFKDHNKALALKPDYAEVYFNRGNGYHRKGDDDRAIVDHTRAIELNPDFAGAYTNRGIAYQNKRDFDRAIRDHYKAIEIKQDYADAYFNLGNTYHRKEDYDRAIEAFSRAIELNPNHADAYNNLRAAQLRRG